MRRALATAFAALLCACEPPPSGREPSPDASATTPPTSEPPPPWLGYAARHWLPGPGNPNEARDADRRAALERGCPTCHADQAADWRGSQHASAWSDASFQRALAIEPLPACEACHAPDGAALEIGCVTCHVELGEAQIWTSGTRLEPARELGCALPVARSPAFAGPQACAACHEFDSDEPRPPGARALLVQSTIAEHAASAASTRSCSDCHMPRARSHAFPGAYDPAMLARALEVEARREADAVVVRLRPGAVGHAVPTGDVFRRLEVSLLAVEADGHERVIDRRALGRRFGPRRSDEGLSVTDELADDRVGPAGQTLRFAVSAADRERTLRWRVVHQRVASLDLGGEATIEGELEVASGLLGAP